MKNPNFPNPGLLVSADTAKIIFMNNNTISYNELNESYGYSMNSGTNLYK